MLCVSSHNNIIKNKTRIKDISPCNFLVGVWLLGKEKVLQGYKKKGGATTSVPSLALPMVSLWNRAGFTAYYILGPA